MLNARYRLFILANAIEASVKREGRELRRTYRVYGLRKDSLGLVASRLPIDLGDCDGVRFSVAQ